VEVQQIIAELNREIAQLKEARALLSGGGTGAVKRGRPAKKSAASETASVTSGTKSTGRKRRLSPEGRKRISEALKRRWAARRKTQEKTAKK
jgi:hypothetical protein